MTIGPVHTTSRTDAAHELTAWTRAAGGRRARALGHAGTLGGHQLDAALRHRLAGDPEIVFTFRDVPRTSVIVAPDQLRAAESIGLIRQLENRLTDLPETLARTSSERDTALAEQNQAREALAGPFKQADALAAARSRVADLAAAIQQHQQPDPIKNDPGGGATARAAVAGDAARARRYQATTTVPGTRTRGLGP